MITKKKFCTSTGHFLNKRQKSPGFENNIFFKYTLFKNSKNQIKNNCVLEEISASMM